MRPVEDGENLAAGSKMLPLRVGASHVGNERAVPACIGTEKHRKMAGKRSGTVVSDQRGETVLLDKSSEFAGVLDTEGGWNIHRGVTS